MKSIRVLFACLGVPMLLIGCGDDSKPPSGPDPTREWTKIATFNHDGPGSAVAAFGGSVFVGGYFQSINGAAYGHLARWDTSGWKAIPGVEAVDVSEFTVHDGVLVARGMLRVNGLANATPLAMWNGTQWTVPDLGRSWQVSAVASAAGSLYAAGSEWNGQRWLPSVYRWTGSGWEMLPAPSDAGNSSSWADAMAEWNGTLILSYGGSDEGRRWAAVVQLVGSTWIPLGDRLASDVDNPYVAAFEVFQGQLYAGGYFDHIGNATARRVARWTGTTWEAAGDGFIGDSGVRDLVVFDGTLVAGGDFRSMDGAIRDIAVWNGTSWSAIGQPWMAEVNAVCVFGDRLIATGPDCVAQW